MYEEKIPIDPTVISTAEEFNMDPTTIALNGGEDYELLFTAPPKDRAYITELGQQLSLCLRRIGVIKEGSKSVLLDKDEQEIALHHTGYQHGNN